MVHDADGNLHYLNQHLEQLDKDEQDQIEGGGNTIEEITGEELYDLIGGDDFSDILTELEINKRAYPNLDFDEALHLVQRYLEHKEKVSRDEYVMFLSKKVFEGLEHWLDTKWLAINSSPDEFLERLAEGISDIVYEEESLSVVDFIESETLLRELLHCYGELSANEQEHARHSIKLAWVSTTIAGLSGAGITRKYVSVHSPTDVAQKFIENNKKTSRGRSLQLSDERVGRLHQTLGITSTNRITDEEACNIYATIVRFYHGREGASKKFQQIVTRLNKEINKELASGKDLKFHFKHYDNLQLVIYTTKDFYVVVNTHVTLFTRGDKAEVVYRKSTHEVLVSHIQHIVKALILGNE